MNAKKVEPPKKEPRREAKRERSVEGLDPCDKAFNDETSRLESADDACDDGVR
jgi:hypothetical protein